MKARIQRRDGDLVVVIPEEVAKEERLGEGAEVILWRIEDISAIDPTAHMTLAEMIEKITPETLHGEIDWGPDVGNEIVEW